MLAFRLNLEQLELFYKVCEEMGATTEEARTRILVVMAKMGQIDGVVDTKLSKSDYIKHMAKQFGSVLNITPKEPPTNAN